MLGMSANSVSALAYRAREGLRQAFLTQHAAELDEDTCRWTHGQLGAYVRGASSRRDATKVEHHLDECRSCMAIYLELTEVNSNLGALLAPLLLGGVATAYLGTTAVSAAAPVGIGVVLGRIRDLLTGNAGVAAVAGVAVSTVVVAGGIALGLRGPTTPTAAPTRAATSDSSTTTSAGGDASTTTGDRSPRSLRLRSGPPARVLPPGDVDVTPGSVPATDTAPGSDPDAGHRPDARQRRHAGHRPGRRRRRRTRRRTRPRTRPSNPTSDPNDLEPDVQPDLEPDVRTRRPTRPRTRRSEPDVQPDLEPDVRPDLNPIPPDEPHPHPGPEPDASGRRRLGVRDGRRGTSDVRRRGAGGRARRRNRPAADRGRRRPGRPHRRRSVHRRQDGRHLPGLRRHVRRRRGGHPPGGAVVATLTPPGSDADGGNNTWRATLG